MGAVNIMPQAFMDATSLLRWLLCGLPHIDNAGNFQRSLKDVIHLLMHPRLALAFFFCCITLLTHVKLVVHQDP